MLEKKCKISGCNIVDHFEDILEMVDIGSGGRRQIPDVRLSRYACYLIVQNGDPAKLVIANGQTYFAIQTRRQELADNRIFQNHGYKGLYGGLDAKDIHQRKGLKITWEARSLHCDPSADAELQAGTPSGAYASG